MVQCQRLFWWVFSTQNTVRVPFLPKTLCHLRSEILQKAESSTIRPRFPITTALRDTWSLYLGLQNGPQEDPDHIVWYYSWFGFFAETVLENSQTSTSDDPLKKCLTTSEIGRWELGPCLGSARIPTFRIGTRVATTKVIFTDKDDVNKIMEHQSSLQNRLKNIQVTTAPI